MSTNTTEPTVYNIPRLGTVTIDRSERHWHPHIEVVLSDDYVGELNDLEQANGLPAGVLFSGSYPETLHNKGLAKELDQFMQILKLWDWDHDGTYDCDEVLQDLVSASMSEHVREFRRPGKGLYTRVLMKLMPPQPERHVVFSYGELQPRFRLWHHVLGVAAVAVVLCLVQLQITYLPWTKYSVVSGVVWMGETLGWIIAALVVASLVMLSRVFRKDDLASASSVFTYGFFNGAAISEEQAFREGAENWNWRQRVASCCVFGAVHMSNLIYPIATIVPLSLAGGLFMWYYLRTYRKTRFRRTAVLASSLVHRVYNRIALYVLVGLLVLLVGTLVYALLAVAATAATVYLGSRGTQAVKARATRQRVEQARSLVQPVNAEVAS